MINKLLSLFGRKLVNLTNSERGWNIMSFGNTSKEKVNNDTALTVSTFYAIIRNISEDIAKLPLNIYRKEGAYRYEETGHPISLLLNYKPNDDMTAMSFRESRNAQMMGWGNGFAFIERYTDGTVKALWPLRPDRVKLKEANSGQIYYEVTDEKGSVKNEWPENIFHGKGLGASAYWGYNIAALASQSIGAGIAIDKFAGSYFGNGLHPSGNLEHPSTLSGEAQKRLKDQFEKQLQGSGNAHGLLVLEEGMKFSQNFIDPKASQLIETRQFSVSEFCRWLRIPPHKVADLSRATFSNIEQQNIDYVTDSLLGWCKRWELEVWSKLLTEKEKRDGYFARHVVEYLLRGDIQTRYNAYSQLWDRGILCANEIRAKEDMNPIDGGDKYFIPLNYTTIEKAGQDDAVVDDIANRLSKAEIAELEKHVPYADENPSAFKEWMDGFYRKHREYIGNAIRPLGIKSVNLDMLSMWPFMEATNAPAIILNDLKPRHAHYIASNLRSYLNG